MTRARPALAPRHALFALAGAFAMLLFYLAVLSLAGGWAHAARELWRNALWLFALAAGFGVQAGLFSLLREAAAASPAGVAASGGASAGAMAACCAHHLADVLPFLGASAAATLLSRYQWFFIALALASNAVGTVYLLAHLHRHAAASGAPFPVPGLGRVPWPRLVLPAAALAGFGVLAAGLFALQEGF